MRRSRALIVAPLSVLTLAACGGSSGPPTMSEFISEANAVCTSTEASEVAVPRPSASSLISPSKSDFPAVASFLNTEIANLQSLVNRLTALGTPPSKVSDWNQGIAAIQQSIADYKTTQAAAASADAAGYTTALGRVIQDGPAIDQSFGSFGATACMSGSASPSPSPAH